MKSIIEKSTGKLICATILDFCLPNETLIDELLTDNFENPYFNFETRTFYNKL